MYTYGFTREATPISLPLFGGAGRVQVWESLRVKVPQAREGGVGVTLHVEVIFTSMICLSSVIHLFIYRNTIFIQNILTAILYLSFENYFF